MVPESLKNVWINAALVALTTHGSQGLKVEKLAKTLGKSKGSFYHHFEDHEALCEAAIASWQSHGAGALLAPALLQPQPEAKLRAVAAAAFAPAPWRALEVAMRAWALEHEGAREAVRAVDEARVERLRQWFEQGQVAPERAHGLAAGFYRVMLGGMMVEAYGGEALDVAGQQEMMKVFLEG